ncbi:MAG: tyrosine--tRNA ligase, partial [Clostridia bacterium]|nr:tyrosine--tRNA ligase [Clostridia bacterium]
GMTFTLLTNSEGKKMGKTASGAVWLSAEKTTPYDFYQYWRNVDDADVIKCMKLLTFVPMDEIREFEKLEGSALNPVKERLAYEVTALVHGEDEAKKVQEAARAVFSGGASGNMPTVEIAESDLGNVMDVMVKAGIVPSKSECRRLIQQGGLTVGEAKVTDIAAEIKVSDFTDGEIIVKKGKKNFYKLIVK